MKSAALTMAALCVCPPAILATSVATVPSVKRAVHNATRPAPAKHKLARAARKPVQTAANGKGVPCDSAPAIRTSSVLPYAIALPPVNTTDAGTGTLPGSSLTGGNVVPGSGTPILFGGGNPGGNPGGGSPGGPTAETPGDPTTPADPGTPVTPTDPETPAVPVLPIPEPGTWLLLISGFGFVGLGLRWRRARAREARALAAASGPSLDSVPRRRDLKKAGGLSSAMAWLGFGEAATGSASMATIAAKTMMCVCPTAAIVGTTMAVPAVRTAVHKATAVPVPAPRYVTTVVKPPCDPSIRSAEADAPSRILDATDASPKMQTALLASTSTPGGQ